MFDLALDFRLSCWFDSCKLTLIVGEYSTEFASSISSEVSEDTMTDDSEFFELELELESEIELEEESESEYKSSLVTSDFSYHSCSRMKEALFSMTLKACSWILNIFL